MVILLKLSATCGGLSACHHYCWSSHERCTSFRSYLSPESAICSHYCENLSPHPSSACRLKAASCRHYSYFPLHANMCFAKFRGHSTWSRYCKKSQCVSCPAMPFNRSFSRHSSASFFPVDGTLDSRHFPGSLVECRRLVCLAGLALLNAS